MGFENRTCLLCESPKVKDRGAYIDCLVCKLKFKPPETFVCSEKERNRYEEHNNNLDDPNYLKYLRRLLDKIEPSRYKSALDFGCGPAQGLKELLKDREEVCVDSYDPYFYPHLKEDRTYDLIYACECVEHFNRPYETFKKIDSLLHKESLLAIRTQFYTEVSDTKLENWWYFRDATHICFYSEETFMWLAESLSWRVKHCESPYVILEKI